jgi:hypothetical protein
MKEREMPTGKPREPARDERTFFKLVATVVSALGGFTGLLIVTGYIIVLSFTSSIHVYGLADFPVEFYKEALISFLKDFIDFYSLRPYLTAAALLIVFAPLLSLRKQAAVSTGPFRKALPILAVIFIFIVIVLTMKLGAIKGVKIGGLSAKHIKDIILFSISIPTLISLILYLAFQSGNFSVGKLTKTSYGLIVFFALSLLAVVPVGYGSALYDIALYRVRHVECKAELKNFDVSQAGSLRVYYLMGHTSGRDIFFDATTLPASLILVERSLIQTIKIGEDSHPMTLRNLLEESSEVKPEGSGGTAIDIFSKEEKEWQKYVR